MKKRREHELLSEQPLDLATNPMSERAIEFVRQGRARFSTVECFAFVPSNYELVWQALDALPRGRFCEWGSGFGIVTGMAEILGFEACGIEVDPDVAAASRSLLSDAGLLALITTGDYLNCDCQADVYFVYCWPSMINATEARFESRAPIDAKLLICFGQSQILCKVRADQALPAQDRGRV